MKDIKSKYTLLSTENIGEFLKDVHAATNDKDIKSQDLISFVDSLICGFREEGRRICRQAPNLSESEKGILVCYGKVVAAYILLCHASRYSTETRAKTLLFLEYASALVRSKYDFVKTAVSVVCYPIKTTGLDWKTIQDALSLDILSYKLINGIRFDKSHGEHFQYAGKGKAVCKNGVLSILSSDVGEAGVSAFSLYDGSVEVVNRNSREEKLKSSSKNDANAVWDFAQTFLKAQGSYVNPKQTKRDYQPGDSVDIEIARQEADSLYCTILGSDNNGGLILNEELVPGTYTEDIIPYLFAGDVICGAKLIIDDDNRISFSIRDAYLGYSLALAWKDYRDNTVFEAKAIHCRKDLDRIIWMTPKGYGAISFTIDGVKEGDIREMSVDSIQKHGGANYINICLPKTEYDSVDYIFDDSEEGIDSILAGFVATEEDIEKDSATADVEQNGSADTLFALALIIANRAEYQPSMDRYESLLTALFLRTLIGDAETDKKLEKAAYMLRIKLAYAQGLPVRSGHSYAYDGEEAGLLALLSQSSSSDGELMKTVAALPDGSVQRQAGELLLGLRLSEMHPDGLKTEPEMIRERICTILGVHDEYRRIGVVRTGKYGQTEKHDVEFKSSYVFRNDGHGADLDKQGRGEVFQAVCGFLNADGGTVYIGVNDAGMPIKDNNYGLQADMSWLCANYQTLNASRARQLGHPTMKADNLDHYVLFLNDEKSIYFKESLLGNIMIEVTEDADAIRICVKPSEFEIAYLYSDSSHSDGVAFVRDGGRTVPMTRVRKEQRLANLKQISRELGFLLTIQEAIDQHRKLIFRNYASGNSGKVEDRYVVPVSLFYNDENVYCYDLKSKTYKQFRLKRISSIDEDVEDPVYTLPLIKPRDPDVFRWLDQGDRRFHIKLRMGVSAKNYLLEEYSCADKLPKEELYPEKKDHWILDTYVNGLGAVRRFFLGLADKIEILPTEDSEELKKSIQDFVEKNIKELEE